MQDTIPVALENGAVRGFILKIFAPLTIFTAHSVSSQAAVFIFLKLLSGDDHSMNSII